MTFKYFAITKIYHFTDLLSYCISSSPYKEALKNNIVTLCLPVELTFCNKSILYKFHDFIDAENVIMLSIL